MKKVIRQKRRIAIWIAILLLSLPIVIAVISTDHRTRSPYITSGEFPFRFVYELNGQIFTIENTISIEYMGQRRPSRPELIITNFFPGGRVWSFRLLEGENIGYMGSVTLLEFRNTESHVRDGVVNCHSRVVLRLGTAAYYMGDTWSDGHGSRIEYFESYPASENPIIFRSRTATLSHEMLEQLFGIRIIEMTFSEPITNRFIRSRN